MVQPRTPPRHKHTDTQTRHAPTCLTTTSAASNLACRPLFPASSVLISLASGPSSASAAAAAAACVVYNCCMRGVGGLVRLRKGVHTNTTNHIHIFIHYTHWPPPPRQPPGASAAPAPAPARSARWAPPTCSGASFGGLWMRCHLEERVLEMTSLVGYEQCIFMANIHTHTHLHTLTKPRTGHPSNNRSPNKRPTLFTSEINLAYHSNQRTPHEELDLRALLGAVEEELADDAHLLLLRLAPRAGGDLPKAVKHV